MEIFTLQVVVQVILPMGVRLVVTGTEANQSAVNLFHGRTGTVTEACKRSERKIQVLF